MSRQEGFTVSGVDPKAIITTYNKYTSADGTKIVVGLHHTSWCGACQHMMPIWNRLKRDLAGQNIQFVENDEEKNPTSWVSYYPTIVRIKNGKTSMYDGRADYEDLRDFVLNVNS
jgi:thiol-disulfide isomerase/thioredoxin